jgi:hypothetical protein
MSADTPFRERQFLTENEVAAILKCSKSKVKRLRLGGCLAYIPARPTATKRPALPAKA